MIEMEKRRDSFKRRSFEKASFEEVKAAKAARPSSLMSRVGRRLLSLD